MASIVQGLDLKEAQTDPGVVDVEDFEGLLSLETFRDVVSFNEGRKLKSYNDTKGNRTVGVGFNLDRAGGRKRVEAEGINFDALHAGKLDLTDEQVDAFLDDDLKEGINIARRNVPSFNKLGAARKMAVADMAINLGEKGFKEFTEPGGTLDLVDRGLYEKAATNLAANPLLRSQIKGRLDRNVFMLRTNKIHPDYLEPGATVAPSLAAALDGPGPDAAAKTQEIAARTGLSTEAVALGEKEYDGAVKLKDAQVQLAQAPVTEEFLTNKDNMAVAQEDVPDLVSFETGFNALRAFADGVVGQFLGASMRGLGELTGVAMRGSRRVGEHMIEPLKWIGLDDVHKALVQPTPWYLKPDEILTRPGNEIVGLSDEFIGVPEGEENVITDVSGALGLMSAQITAAIVSGGLSSTVVAGTLIGQGADIQAQEAEAAGVKGTTEGDTAIVAGSAITAVTEKYGLNLILNRIPASQKNRIMKILSSFSVEFAQELVENIMHNLTIAGLYDAERDLTPDLYEPTVAGTAAAIIGALIPNRSPVRATRTSNVMDKLNEIAVSSPLNDRSPERAADHRIAVVHQSGLDTVAIPAPALYRWAHEHEDGAAAAFRSIGINAEVEITPEGDIEIGAEGFARGILGTPEYDKLKDDIRVSSVDPDAHTRSQALAIIEGAKEELDVQLELVPEGEISPGLRNQVSVLIGKIGKREDTKEAIDKAPSIVTSVLDGLLAQVQARTEDVESIKVRGRLREMDNRIADLNRQIVVKQNKIQERKGGEGPFAATDDKQHPDFGKPTLALETALDKLEVQKLKLVTEQEDLLDQIPVLSPRELAEQSEDTKDFFKEVRNLPSGPPATAEDFTPENVGNVIEKTDFAILTAELKANTPEENAKAQEELRATLKEQGFEVLDATGRFEGSDETSIVVLNITPEQAMELGQQLNQEAVITHEGMVVYESGTLIPIDKVKVMEKVPKVGNFTQVSSTGAIFTFDLADDEVPLVRDIPEPVTERLPGLPKVQPDPNPRVQAAAKKYGEQSGIPYVRAAEYVAVDVELGKRLAEAYENMKHDPDNKAVKAAYEAMAKETMAQWKVIKEEMGLEVEFIEGNNPYATPAEAIIDINENNHLWVFSTRDGFGPEEQMEGREGFDPSDNPLLQESGETISGQPALINDIFRVVHDVFGHAKEGNGFGPSGEENAWQSHVRMYSPKAARAMTSETRGQNSWVNYGPRGEENRANPRETVFADQKTGLMPKWTTTEGLAKDVDPRGSSLKSDQPPSEVEPKADINIKAGILDRLSDKKARAEIRAIRKGFKEGLRAAKGDKKAAQNELIEVINSSGLAPKDKSKFIKTIRDIDTFEQLEARMPGITARIETMLNKAQRSKLMNVLKRMLSKTRAKRDKSGKRIGSPRDAPTMDLLDKAREIMAMDKDAAWDRMKEMLSAPSPSPGQLMEISLLAARSGTEQFTNADMVRLVEDIASIIALGKQKANTRAERRRRKTNDLIAEASHGVTRGDDIDLIDHRTISRRTLATFGIDKDLTTSFGGLYNDWDSLMDIVFNKKGVNVSQFIEATRMSDAVQDVKLRIETWETKLKEAGMRIFGFSKQRQFVDKLREDEEIVDLGKKHNQPLKTVDGKKVHVWENAAGRRVRLEYSVAQARKFWMEMQDETVAEAYTHPDGNAYTPEMVQAIYGMMTPDDRVFAQAQLDLYTEMYPEINAVYRRMYGVSMPFNPTYSPVKRNRGGQPLKPDGASLGADRILTEEVGFRAPVPSSLKGRTKNILPFEKLSDTGSMMRYIHEMAHFVETAEKAQLISDIMGNGRLRDEIAASHGPNMVKQIDAFVLDFSKGYASRSHTFDTLFQRFNRPFARSVLALKPTIGAKQLVSYFAYGEGMPPGALASGTAKFFKNPKKWIKLLHDSSILIRNRGSSPDFEFSKIAKEGPGLSFLQAGSARLGIPGTKVKSNITIDDLMMAFIRYGDRAPIYTGGTARYIWEVTPKSEGGNGKTHEEAIKIIERLTASTQQSNDIDKLPEIARSGALGRTFAMFATAKTSLLRRELLAIRQFVRGKITPREFGKRMAIYHIAIPSLIQYIASGFSFEEDRQLLAVMFGQLNNIIIFGEIINAAVAAFFVEDLWDVSNDMPIAEFFADIGHGILEIAESEWEVEYLLDGMTEIMAALAQTRGAPLPTLLNAWDGVLSMWEGDDPYTNPNEFTKGLRQMSGISESIAERASTDAEGR